MRMDSSSLEHSCTWGTRRADLAEAWHDDRSTFCSRVCMQCLCTSHITYANRNKIVWTAYREHVSAMELGREMRKAFGQPEPPGFIKKLPSMPKDFCRTVYNHLKWIGNRWSYGENHLFSLIDAESHPTSQKHQWTHMHSLYATMGGFVVDTQDMAVTYLPFRHKRLSLTPEGLKFLAACIPDLLPDLPKSAILDKSKANTFTKLLTCGQALWFGIQCLTRSTQGLSISLLELNTAVHAACALALYSQFWWDKPLDVEEPTALTHIDTHPVIALLIKSCSRYGRRYSLSPMDLEDDQNLDQVPDSETVIHHPGLRHVVLRPSKDPQFPRQQYLVYHGFVISTSDEIMGCTILEFADSEFELLRLASMAVKKYKSYTEIQNIAKGKSWKNFMAIRMHNWPQVDHPDGKFVILAYSLAGFFYGAIHLAVWNRPFRSHTEELLWKISSLCVLSSVLTPILFGLSWMTSFYFGSFHNRVKSALEWIGIHGFALFALFYVLCRTFLIVECFLDVFHLPDSAFEVPQWSQYFPHIG